METPVVPYISGDEMRAVDQGMVSICGISMVQMMEHAGRLLAVLAVQEFLKEDEAKPVIVLIGSGGNGGGGLVCARNLSNWGFDVQVISSRSPDEFWAVTALQHRITRRIGVSGEPVDRIEKMPNARLLVDAIIGYGLQGAPTGGAARLIELANESKIPILSLDIPSGVDASTGETLEPFVRADATLTLALPKRAFLDPEARKAAGRVFLGDIGVPPSLYRELGIPSHRSPFVNASIVRLAEPPASGT